jgi:hypothetical protein
MLNFKAKISRYVLRLKFRDNVYSSDKIQCLRLRYKAKFKDVSNLLFKNKFY